MEKASGAIQSQIREKYGKEVSSSKHSKQGSAEGNREGERDVDKQPVSEDSGPHSLTQDVRRRGARAGR